MGLTIRAAVIVIASLFSVDATPAFGCRIGSIPYERDATATRLVVEATPSLVSGPVHRLPPFPRNVYSLSRRPGLSDPREQISKPAPGQVFRLVRAAGAGARSLREESEIVLVPWGYRMDCQPVLWPADTHWVAPAQTGIIEAYLRPREEWVGNRPTLDVVAAGHQPYPQSTAPASEDGSDLQPWLTVEEYWQLLNMLPTAEEVAQDTSGASTAILEWARNHPDLASRFPASEIVAYFRDLLARNTPQEVPQRLTRPCASVRPAVGTVPDSLAGCLVEAAITVTSLHDGSVHKLAIAELQPVEWATTSAFLASTWTGLARSRSLPSSICTPTTHT